MNAHGSTLDMNGINQSSIVAAANMHNLAGNLSGFTPNNINMTAAMNQSQHGNAPNMSASPMHMFLQQQQLISSNGGQMASNMEDSDLIGTNQHQ